MKKTIFIILAILPIFLVISIAFAGRILALYQHISVEKVTFVDENKNEYEENYLFTLNVGETKETYIIVYPELATNKTVTYTSQNPEFCTVDEKGVLTGISYGSTSIVVKTNDGSKMAILNVKVTQDNVTGITLPFESLELMVGDTKTLTAVVTPSMALNKRVTYSTSNAEIVTITANGLITGVSTGEATITATTEDGGFTATCKVTVVMGIPALKFDFTSSEEVMQQGVLYRVLVDKINLMDYLVIDESRINKNDVVITIVSGKNYVEFDGNTITFIKNGVVNLMAYVGSQENPTHQTAILVLVRN